MNTTHRLVLGLTAASNSLPCLLRPFSIFLTWLHRALLGANYRDARLEILDFSVNLVPADWQSSISTFPDRRLGGAGQGVNGDLYIRDVVLLLNLLGRERVCSGLVKIGGVGGTSK